MTVATGRTHNWCWLVIGASWCQTWQRRKLCIYPQLQSSELQHLVIIQQQQLSPCTHRCFSSVWLVHNFHEWGVCCTWVYKRGVYRPHRSLHGEFFIASHLSLLGIVYHLRLHLCSAPWWSFAMRSVRRQVTVRALRNWTIRCYVFDRPWMWKLCKWTVVAILHKLWIGESIQIGSFWAEDDKSLHATQTVSWCSCILRMSCDDFINHSW